MSVVSINKSLKSPDVIAKIPKASAWYNNTYFMWKRWLKPDNMSVGEFQSIYLSILENLYELSGVIRDHPEIEDCGVLDYIETACSYVHKRNAVYEIVEGASTVCKAFKSGDLTTLGGIEYEEE